MSRNLEIILATDKETYAINSINFHPIKTQKTQIILGGSLRSGSNNIQHLKTKDFGMTKKWPTFTISREGIIYQHYDPMYYSEYMGVKEIDKKSISVVLENMGVLYYDANRECFLNWINEQCDDNLVYEKLWKNCRYWEHYFPAHYLSLSLLINDLIEKMKIERNCIGYNVFDENTFDFNGVVTRSNYDSDFTDLNPSFDFKKLLQNLEIKI